MARAHKLVNRGQGGQKRVKHYKVAIVDDDPLQAAELCKLVEQCVVPADLSATAFESLSAFEASLENEVPDIVFMDIVFPSEAAQGEGVLASAGFAAARENIAGIDAVSRLLEEHDGVQVIYVTGYIELCTRVYRTRHVSFLPKPVNEADLEEALCQAVDNLNERVVRPFALKVGGRIMSVDPADVEYIESDRRKVRIFMDDRTIEAYESLSSITRKLPGSFVQCHKSFVVNMDRIAEMRSDAVEMRSGTTLPVSQKRRRESREAFAEHLRGRL
ncbi:MAG: response regulator transcription factor [Eggerthellaceae bacterium]|nr:response regulator transcription factor [Eggerthellaceae bacterium]